MTRSASRAHRFASAVTIMTLAAAPVAVAAQSSSLTGTAWTPPTVAATLRDDAGLGATPLVAAGLLGAAIGFFGGGATGYTLERASGPCGCEDPGLTGLIVGAAVGSAVAVPVAVHLANARRGAFRRTFGASVAVGAAGLLGFYASDASEGGVILWLGAPIVEVIVSTIVERATTVPDER